MILILILASHLHATLSAFNRFRGRCVVGTFPYPAAIRSYVGAVERMEVNFLMDKVEQLSGGVRVVVVGGGG